MELAILTSSRAEYGLYKPLLSALKKQKRINGRLVVFGTHLSPRHGNTVDQIRKDGNKIYKEIHTIMNGDSPRIISETIGKVHAKFAALWSENKFDLILCLGDRYEMYAAVSASVPFNIPIAHISGGETTLGAIDNYFRHAITLMSSYHFTNTKNNAKKVRQLTGSKKNIHFTGALAIDNIRSTGLLSGSDFKKQFNFDISKPFVLFTFHPETVRFERNSAFALILRKVLSEMDTPVLVTMPNADTLGNVIRKELQWAAKDNGKIHIVESLGSQGYYTALKHCLFVMGNSSSGIVEAASFGKYVLNLGDRQRGREQGKNIMNLKISEKEIYKGMENLKKKPSPGFENIYGDGKAANRIMKVLGKIKF